MDSTENGRTQSSEQDRPEKRLARGLEDVSYLFVSQGSDVPPAREEARDAPSEQPRARPTQAITILVSSPSAAVTREHLISLLSKNAGALEQGMRTIDVNIPCAPHGQIELLAVDAAGQLAVIEVDVSVNDGMLLRAICHVDWLVGNIPIIRRIYHGQVINFSSPPRIFLVAPEFSLMLTCAAHRITGPRVSCVRYHPVSVPNGAGIFFECI